MTCEEIARRAELMPWLTDEIVGEFSDEDRSGGRVDNRPGSSRIFSKCFFRGTDVTLISRSPFDSIIPRRLLFCLAFNGIIR
jgi:hypothetical protein